MQDLIEQSIDHVYTFYESMGVAQEGPPSFVFIDEDYALNPYAVGLVNILPDEEGMQWSRKMQKKISDTRQIQMGLMPLNDDAFEEQVERVYVRMLKQPEFQRSKRQIQHDKDINFFRALRDLSSYPPARALFYLYSHVSHEMWHDLEKKKGIFHPALAEGTAQYASHVVVQEMEVDYGRLSQDVSIEPRLEPPQNPFLDALSSMKQRTLYECQLKAVSYYAPKLQDLLHPSWRKHTLDIHDLFLENAAAQDTDDKGPYYRRLFPELNILDQGLTPENLLDAYRQAGLEKTADEIEGQDLTKLLAQYAAMGYGP